MMVDYDYLADAKVETRGRPAVVYTANPKIYTRVETGTAKTAKRYPRAAFGSFGSS